MRDGFSTIRYEVDRADASLKKALRMRERVYGSEHPDLCNHLGYYATLQRVRGEFLTARALNERVLRICETYAGKESVLAAQALHEIGNVVEGT